jgi:hypothetical protein
VPAYQWQNYRPPGRFNAQQINSLEDLQAWVDSLTEVELSGMEMSYSDLVVEGLEPDTDNIWVLALTQERLGEGILRYRIKEPFGTYMVAAQQEYKTIFPEPAEIFETRFEPLI